MKDERMMDAKLLRVMLDKAHMAVSRSISDRERLINSTNLELHQYYDMCLRQMILTIEGTFAASEIKHRVDVAKRWPKDWWQAFRERWMPAWWLAKYPVQYEVFELHKTFETKICPHLDASGRGQCLEFMIRKETP